MSGIARALDHKAGPDRHFALECRLGTGELRREVLERSQEEIGRFVRVLFGSLVQPGLELPDVRLGKGRDRDTDGCCRLVGHAFGASLSGIRWLYRGLRHSVFLSSLL